MDQLSSREVWLSKILYMDEGTDEAGAKRRLRAETLAWEIWKERCRSIHDGYQPRPDHAIKADITLFDECWTTMHAIPNTTTRNREERPARWKKSCHGTIKVNCDGSWEGRTGKGEQV